MFDLARQMRLLGQDVEVFTGNPRSRVDKDLRDIACTYPWIRVIRAVGQRFGFPESSKLLNLDMRTLGSWVANSIHPETTDILDGLDGPGPEAGRRMKEHGKVWVCNRGSAHILTQKALLEEEHQKWNVQAPRFSPEHLERCLAEYSEADAVVVPSQFAKRSFIDHEIAPERVFVCPYGVDLSVFHRGPKNDDIFRVIFVGGISIRKGIGYLLEAIAPLARRSQCEVWLIGGIEPAARSILVHYSNVFEYKGVQPSTELWRFYSQASVLVLPSIEEGLALVQAQAMACGLPVIATTNTGAEDLFTDGVEGFIVGIRDAGAIREKIEWMIANPVLRSEMGEAALARTTHIGGWTQYGERVLSVYCELMARVAGQPSGPHSGPPQ